MHAFVCHWCLPSSIEFAVNNHPDLKSRQINFLSPSPIFQVLTDWPFVLSPSFQVLMDYQVLADRPFVLSPRFQVLMGYQILTDWPFVLSLGFQVLSDQSFISDGLLRRLSTRCILVPCNKELSNAVQCDANMIKRHKGCSVLVH